MKLNQRNSFRVFVPTSELSDLSVATVVTPTGSHEKKASRLLGTMVVNNTNTSRYMSFRRCPKNSEILYRVSLCRDEIHADIRPKLDQPDFFFVMAQVDYSKID